MIIILFLGTFFSQDDIGTTMYPFLKVGLGPRPVALGETFVGLADDINAVSWNPAGLAYIKDLQFLVSHQEWFMDFRDEYFVFGVPGLDGYFTMSGFYSSVRDVEIWNDNNDPLGTVNLWSGVFSVAYGHKLKANLSYGASLKAIAEDLYEQALFDFAIDVGAKVALNKDWELGGVLKNLTYKTDLPSDVKVGCCYQGFKQTNLLLDLSLPRDNMMHVNFGLEYSINPFFSIRTGWRSGPYDISGLGWLSGFTAGFGIKYSGIRFDYAFVPYGKLGLTHRIGLSGGLGIIKGTNGVIIKVLDGDTKKPIAGNINLTGIKEGNFETDKSGVIEFKNLLSGWLYINTYVSGYPQNLDSVYIPPEGRAEKFVYLYQIRPGILRGLVFDAATKKPISAVVSYKGMAMGTIINDSIAGSFVLRDLPPGFYELMISGKDPAYIPQMCSLTIEPGKLTERTFYLIRKWEKIILKGINFDTGKADLKPEAYPVLDDAGRILLDNPDIVVELAGHTDPREISTTTYPSNWELSFARAQVVCKYLIDKFGIEPQRLMARGYADTQPITLNTTEEGMAQNRRTEFRVMEQ